MKDTQQSYTIPGWAPTHVREWILKDFRDYKFWYSRLWYNGHEVRRVSLGANTRSTTPVFYILTPIRSNEGITFEIEEAKGKDRWLPINQTELSLVLDYLAKHPSIIEDTPTVHEGIIIHTRQLLQLSRNSKIDFLLEGAE